MKLSRRRLFGLIGASTIGHVVEPVAKALAAEQVVAPMMPTAPLSAVEAGARDITRTVFVPKLVVQLYKQSPLITAM